MGVECRSVQAVRCGSILATLSLQLGFFPSPMHCVFYVVISMETHCEAQTSLIAEVRHAEDRHSNAAPLTDVHITEAPPLAARRTFDVTRNAEIAPPNRGPTIPVGHSRVLIAESFIAETVGADVSEAEASFSEFHSAGPSCIRTSEPPLRTLCPETDGHAQGWDVNPHGEEMPEHALREQREQSVETGADGLADAFGGAPVDGESDAMLLARLLAGEDSAMAKLWRKYAPLLFSQALKILHNPSECEDVVAEVFSEIWQRAATYHAQRANPAAWMVTLVRRRAIDKLRERRSFERAEKRLFCEFATRPNSCREDEQLRIADLRWLLDQALAKLTEQQRQTVCMAYFQGLTQKEISERTQTPIGTVKTRLELALRKMRTRIRGTRLTPTLSIRQDVH